MEEMDDRDRIIKEAVRINNFLIHNQLVQANALTQKLQNILEDCFKAQRVKDPQFKLEEHKFYSAFKSVLLTNSWILAGKTQDAITQINLVFKQV